MRFGFLTLGLATLALACGGTVTTGGGGGGAGAGGPGPCDAFVDQTDDGAPRPTTVRFVNLSATTLYLGDPTQGCYGYVPYSLERDGVAVAPRLGGCTFTCETLMSGQCSCPAICEQSSIVRIVPGGSYELTWAGFDYLPETLPQECGAQGCAGACYVPRFASGLYEVTGTAYTTLEGCGEPGSCDCVPDESGSCSFFDGTALVSGAPLSTSVTYDYASDVWELELVFE